jgi:hypothetical protein
MTIEIQELSLVEQAEIVQVHFTHEGEAPKKISWMKSLHGVLHSGLWIRFHVLPEFSLGPLPRGGPDANILRP